jgi:hypothetical protein
MCSRNAQPDKVTSAVVEFVDFAGWSGSRQGEALAISSFRISLTVCVIHVVRCFDDETSACGRGRTPRDIAIATRAFMADMDMVEARIDKAKKMAKGAKKISHEPNCLKTCGNTSTADCPPKLCLRRGRPALIATPRAAFPQAGDLRGKYDEPSFGADMKTIRTIRP